MTRHDQPAAPDPARQQRAAEYFLENASLTADLTDTQARALIDWASRYAYAAAGDPARSEQDIDTLLVNIRHAVRHAAAVASHTADADAASLVTLARQVLQHDIASSTDDPHTQPPE